ncbi:hypothetical protein KC939_01590 [Candidatus Saccharibacteria bacterium]|nr:hypothetical protein [Candidatus Saccharibacteria bacterium]
MKYHYQEGISDRKEGGKLKLVLLSIVALAAIGYTGFISLTPALNGWPLTPIDETADALESSNPGEKGNQLYIPRLNVSSPIDNLSLEGNPSKEDDKVTIQGKSFQLGLTPQQTRESSPFYYLDKLQSGDEIFLDYNNTRYAYRVSSKDDSNLTLKSSSGATIKAEAVGTVARENGKLEVEGSAF